MKRVITKFGILLMLFVCCGVKSYGQAKTGGVDSIKIYGKFLSPCSFPGKIKIWKYNPMDYNINSLDIPVSKEGEFYCSFLLAGPQQISMRVDQTVLDFMALPNEKTYSLEIACNPAGQKRLTVKNSTENQAFITFFNLSKATKDSVDKISKLNLTQANNFQMLSRQLLAYQEQVTAIAQSHPNTYTARVLCPSVILPKPAFSSIGALKESMLQITMLANPMYYRTNIFPNYVCVNYFTLSDKNDFSFTGFEKALNIASSNPDAGKIFQQILYYIFTAQKKEQLLAGYIAWAKLHPERMHNLVVKSQLANMEYAIAGATFQEVILKDPRGVSKKLSDEVASGKLTLLIFYSPTCSHCQEYLPQLVPLWNQYKNKGLKIYAVANEATSDEWADFIKTKSSAEWTNVFENIDGPKEASKYMLTSIPVFILIDQQGKIITRYANKEYLLREIPKYFEK